MDASDHHLEEWAGQLEDGNPVSTTTSKVCDSNLRAEKKDKDRHLQANLITASAKLSQLMDSSVETPGRIRNKELFNCSHCGKRFMDNWKLQQHEKTHTGAKPFTCVFCGKDFIQKGNFLLHMKSKHVLNEKPNHDREVRTKASPVIGEESVGTGKGDSPLDMNSSSLSENDSNLSVSGEATEQMDERNIEARKQHQDVDMEAKGQLEVSHNDSNISAVSDSNLSSEKRDTNHQQCPYNCPTCDKKFETQNALTKHKLQHESERQKSGENHFNCKMCEKKFTSKFYLTKHEKKHHYFTCTCVSTICVCDITLNQESSLKMHMTTRHPGLEKKTSPNRRKSKLNPKANFKPDASTEKEIEIIDLDSIAPPVNTNSSPLSETGSHSISSKENPNGKDSDVSYMATYIPELDINLDARETSAYQPSGFQILSTSKEGTSEKHNNKPTKESKGVANSEGRTQSVPHATTYRKADEIKGPQEVLDILNGSSSSEEYVHGDEILTDNESTDLIEVLYSSNSNEETTSKPSLTTSEVEEIQIVSDEDGEPLLELKEEDIDFNPTFDWSTGLYEDVS